MNIYNTIKLQHMTTKMTNTLTTTNAMKMEKYDKALFEVVGVLRNDQVLQLIKTSGNSKVIMYALTRYLHTSNEIYPYLADIKSVLDDDEKKWLVEKYVEHTLKHYDREDVEDFVDMMEYNESTLGLLTYARKLGLK